MEWINKKTILIVGLGLMGGSYAMALKSLGYTVTAIDTSEESIDYAVKNSIIDRGSTTPDQELIGGADAVVFALAALTISIRFAIASIFFASDSCLSVIHKHHLGVELTNSSLP